MVILGSCTTQKNTLITRTYHNITSKYNILFNGAESFKKGQGKITESHEDNFTEILPIFLYGDETSAQMASSDMDRTIKKAEKLVSLHSITVKPEVKNNKPLTQKQREFFNKKEYNKWVDNNYLLMGKAYFYKQEYDKAKEIFLFMLNEYKNEKSLYETRIWLARLYNQTSDFKNSEEILENLKNDVNLPKKLKVELNTTYADYYIKQNNFDAAIPYLELAKKQIRKKRFRVRVVFILAQLYERTGKLKKASEYYDKVIKMNPPYEMTFNAKINRALAYEKGFGSVKEIENQLHKMLRDDKNIDYQDQIYYALGNLAFKEGNIPKAIEQYSKSVEINTGNTSQKTRSYLTLANLYYDMPDYVKSQSYYDSAVVQMDMSYPDYDVIYSKSKNLTSLVKEINTVNFEDSVQALAKLNKNELINYIDDLIEQVRDREEEDRIQEREKQLNQQYSQTLAMKNRSETMNNAGGTSWYFYNETAKSLGFKEFKMKWGNRKLEDNWRRLSKASPGFASTASTNDTEFITDEDTEQNNNLSNKSREFYLQHIPSNDSMLQASHRKIEKALYNMGLIYKNDLKDTDKAIESFRELIKRYPNTNYLLSVYYNIYAIYKLQNNIPMSETYKNKIINEFPNSTYAKLLTNPSYIKELEEEENKVKKYYVATYEKYHQGSYTEVINRCNYANSNYPDDKLIPKFDYLKTLSIGKTQDIKSFKANLYDIVSKYPGTDISENAKDIIAYLDKEHPQIKEDEEIKIAQKLYEFLPNSTHTFIFVVPKGLNANQLKFNIINFNLDNFDDLNLKVESAELNDRQSLIVIKPFKNKDQAISYFNQISTDKSIFSDVDSQGIMGMAISEPNLAILKTDKLAERYMKFFNENYR